MKLSTIRRHIKEANEKSAAVGNFDEFMSSIEQLEKHAKQRRVMEPAYSREDLLADVRRELPDINTAMANKMVNFVFKHIDADIAEASIHADMQSAPTAEELDVGETVKIVGQVNYQGKTGHIDSFGSDKKFVIVDLGNNGLRSFHSSDVCYYVQDDNDQAEDNDLEENSIISSEQSLTLDEQFDIIEDMVEQIAQDHGVDAELIWEDFEVVDDSTLLETAAWQKKSGKNKNGGLNAKGVASYRKQHPGSKLQTAVTTKPSKLKKGSKAAKRRKSFCARMGGMKGPMKKPNGDPTRKALALKKWNCRESIEDNSHSYITSEAEGDAQGLEHVTKELLQHIVQQIGTQGANAIIKSLKYGDGAAKELLQMIKQDLEKNIPMAESVNQRLDKSCWTGKHKQGTKTVNGVTVNNCVANEGVAEVSIEEAQSLKSALSNALSKVEPGSKLDQKIKAHNRSIKSGQKGSITSPPEGYRFKKDGSIVVGVNEDAAGSGSTSRNSQQKQAHENNLDVAQKEMDRREAEGEDMSTARIDKTTYKIIKPKKQGVAEAEYNPDTFVGKKTTYKEYGITQEGPHQFSISASTRKFTTLDATKRHVDKKLSEGVIEAASGDSAEAYKAHLIKTMPAMMALLSKTLDGWAPSKDQILAAIDTAYAVMKHTGDKQQAGQVLMTELNTLHQTSHSVAEDVSDNPKDVITVDVPLFIRLMEYAREDANTDMDLHIVTEKLTTMSANGRTLTMADYDAIISTDTVEETTDRPTHSEKSAFQRGYEAGLSRRPESNPYTPSTQEDKDFRDGQHMGSLDRDRHYESKIQSGLVLSEYAAFKKGSN